MRRLRRPLRRSLFAVGVAVAELAACRVEESSAPAVPDASEGADAAGHDEAASPGDGSTDAGATNAPIDYAKLWGCDASEPTEPDLLGGRLRAALTGPPCAVDAGRYVCADGERCVYFGHYWDGGPRCSADPCAALACTGCEKCAARASVSPTSYACVPCPPGREPGPLGACL